MIFLVILLFALFASLFGLSKSTLDYGEPFFLIGSRMTFAGVLLLLQQILFNRKHLHFKILHIGALALLGLFGIYLTNVAEIWGLQHMSSAKACLIYSLSPFIAALVAYLMLGETLNTKKWLGMGIGFLGLIPIFMARSQSEALVGEIASISFADLSLLIAVVCSVFGWVLLKKIVTDYNYSPLFANGVAMLMGGCLALLHSYLAGEQWNPVPVSQLKPFVQNALLMSLISNIVCYNLYGFLLKHYSATFMAFAGLVTPLFASLFGWLFLDETITWHFYVSMSLFSLGLSIFYYEESDRNA
jgi:drug/metabolite transporter (DMT)-like permease